MYISIFELFSINIGPSSSHTTGPMYAANSFIAFLKEQKKLANTNKLVVELYGSLALTGVGHKTDTAILMGLEGEIPEKIVTENINERVAKITIQKQINLYKEHLIDFDPSKDILWLTSQYLPRHSNGMKFIALNPNNDVIYEEIYYSIGGGFIVREKEFDTKQTPPHLKYPYRNAEELLQICEKNNITIKDVILTNETHWRTEDRIRAKLLNLAKIMEESIVYGCKTHGVLDGVLHLKRRAPILYDKLQSQESSQQSHDMVLNWVSTYAMAVAEENAAGHRVISAPTNGAAGVVPAVLQYYKKFCNPSYSDEDIINYLTTAGAIAQLYKMNASISGAEVGCQGEIGVACSMAAGALTAALGGNIRQIFRAAITGMEHNLGLTCDPIAGLVQVPCIGRNAAAAVQAIHASKLSLFEGDNPQIISLDEIILTMKKTGADMHEAYKETSKGGLATNVCFHELSHPK